MEKTSILIRSGRVVDPASGTDAEADVLIEDRKIRSIAKSISSRASKIIPAKGKLVLPGLIDMHTHLRDPGRPDEEDIASGTRAAAKGGFTSIACMPNTDPVIDTDALVEYVISKAKAEGVVNVFPVGAVTKGRRGEELSEMGRMLAQGAVAFSDDGSPIVNTAVMRRALEYLRQFDIPLISHPEDISLSSGGVMNEGYTSTILGLPPIPALSEEIMVDRDIKLAREFGKVHLAHVSTARSVELIRKAKDEGIAVTAETAPHYFTLTENEVEGYNTNAKMNPPLRTEKDVAAIINGLKDGTIDCIATDHAPHTVEEKKVEFGKAAFGIVGLETALPIVLTELVATGSLTLKKAIEKLTVAPAKILKLKKGSLKPGSDADVIIVDISREVTVDAEKFASRGKNSPFVGWKLKGLPQWVVVAGKIVVAEGKLL